MPFQKGNKLAGSRKGIKNQKTQQWEVFAEYCMNGGLERFQQELEMLHGKDYVNAFLTLLEFHRPKLSRQTIAGDDENPIVANVKWIGNIPPNGQ